MLPLLGRPSDGQAVLHPDANAADVEAGFLEGPPEVDALQKQNGKVLGKEK